MKFLRRRSDKLRIFIVVVVVIAAAVTRALGWW
jgi:hypothetical protein